MQVGCQDTWLIAPGGELPGGKVVGEEEEHPWWISWVPGKAGRARRLQLIVLDAPQMNAAFQIKIGVSLSSPVKENCSKRATSDLSIPLFRSILATEAQQQYCCI